MQLSIFTLVLISLAFIFLSSFRKPCSCSHEFSCCQQWYLRVQFPFPAVVWSSEVFIMLRVVVSPSMIITNADTDVISLILVVSILWVLDVSCIVFSCQSFYCDSMLFLELGIVTHDRVSKLPDVICTAARRCLMALLLLLVADLRSALHLTAILLSRTKN